MSFDYRRSIFDHVQLGVTDRSASERFYRTVLEAPRDPHRVGDR
jgi:catechol 2,3-dioxygenase-like lactoylglutathione lyase family enzyme